ncbi:MAG: transcriptional regulator [Sphaerobacteraceae bacterium]|nr:MAG: transcriptional regulator [Sphaerobacteraceae bacterium]
MAKRTYGQFCGIARALELVGERWGMLVVRDLLGEPKRFSELHRGLKSIPTNILTTRLREMEQSGVIERTRSEQSPSVVVYRLTPYGRELEDVLLRLGRWGARSLPVPEDGHGYVDPAIRALRGSFKSDRAGDWTCLISLEFGTFEILINVQDGAVEIREGFSVHSDLTIDVRGSLIPVLSKQVSLDSALDARRIDYCGNRAELERFLYVFAMEHPI